MTRGKIFGVGLGPGAADLMTVRADRILRDARDVAFFRKRGRPGQARGIVDGLLSQTVQEYPMEYPVTTEISFESQQYNDLLSSFYEECCERLFQLTEQGRDVIVLCEGDPFFYGSFMHLHVRLHGKCDVEVVPAVSGMSAAWTATGVPITWGDDVLSTLMATLPQRELDQKTQESDAVVFMKIGRNLDKVRTALQRADKYADAWLVEYAAMAGQTVQKLSDYMPQTAPYFSIVIVHGQGRRP